MNETSCKQCKFAMYKDKTQTDCLIGKIDDFRKQNINIIEAYDEEKEFYVIQRICQYYRGPNWLYYNDEDLECCGQVDKEVCIQCDFVVYIDSEVLEDKIISTCKSILHSEIKPSQVVFIVNHNDIKPAQIRRIAEQFGVKYRIELITKATKDQCINFMGDKCLGTYFAIFDAGYEIPPDYLTKLNNIINTDMKSLLVYLPKNITNGVCISKAFFEGIGRNIGRPFTEKLEDLSVEQKKEYVVYE
jgi:hypothetical protein